MNYLKSAILGATLIICATVLAIVFRDANFLALLLILLFIL